MLQQPFYLIVIDKYQKTFSVEGPMTDDRQWNHAVVVAQKSGRRVRCSTANGLSAEAPRETGGNDIRRRRCRPARSICLERRL